MSDFFIGKLKMLKCEERKKRQDYECMFEVENEFGDKEYTEGWLVKKPEYERLKKIKIGEEVLLRGYPEGIAKGDYLGGGEFAKYHIPYSVWESMEKADEIDVAIYSNYNLTKEQCKVLKNLKYEHHVGNHWAVGHGDTKYVMTTLGLSREKADKLIMKVLDNLDEKYGYR